MQLALRSPVIAGRDAVRASRPAVAAAAALSLLAAWVHFAYMGSHFDVWWAEGAFFLASGVAQSLLVVALVRRPGPAVAWLGIAANLAIVATYVWSRTAGVPVGPHAHVPERSGAVDLSTTGAEIVIVALLLTLLGPGSRRWLTNLVLAGGLLLWIARLTDHLP